MAFRTKCCENLTMINDHRDTVTCNVCFTIKSVGNLHYWRIREDGCSKQFGYSQFESHGNRTLSEEFRWTNADQWNDENRKAFIESRGLLNCCMIPPISQILDFLGHRQDTSSLSKLKHTKSSLILSPPILLAMSSTINQCIIIELKSQSFLNYSFIHLQTIFSIYRWTVQYICDFISTQSSASIYDDVLSHNEFYYPYRGHSYNRRMRY